jgi:hypothetical protein
MLFKKTNKKSLHLRATPTTSLFHPLLVKNRKHHGITVPTDSIYSSLAISLAIPSRRLVFFGEPVCLAIPLVPAQIDPSKPPVSRQIHSQIHSHAPILLSRSGGNSARGRSRAKLTAKSTTIVAVDGAGGSNW